MTLLVTKVFYVINLKISFILIYFVIYPHVAFNFSWLLSVNEYLPCVSNYAMDLEEVKYGEDIDLAWKFSSPRLRIICKTIVCITHRMENSKMPLLVPKRNRSLQRMELLENWSY